MNQEKINDICEDFKKALQRLKEALSEDTTGSSIVIDGTIQRFEFTFELAWKLAKAILNYEGVEVETPRMVIKEAFKARLIKDGDGWIDMLKDRVLRYDFYADCGEVFDVWRVFKKTNPPTSPFTKGGGVPIRRMGRGILVAAEGRLRNKTSHIYDEQQALKIYKKIKEKYFDLLNEFSIEVSERSKIL